jgi:hypothetical protein
MFSRDINLPPYKRTEIPFKDRIQQVPRFPRKTLQPRLAMNHEEHGAISKLMNAHGCIISQFAQKLSIIIVNAKNTFRFQRGKEKMNYPAASHEVSTGKIRSKGEASFGELNPPMGD